MYQKFGFMSNLSEFWLFEVKIDQNFGFKGFKFDFLCQNFGC